MNCLCDLEAVDQSEESEPRVGCHGRTSVGEEAKTLVTVLGGCPLNKSLLWPFCEVAADAGSVRLAVQTGSARAVAKTALLTRKMSFGLQY